MASDLAKGHAKQPEPQDASPDAWPLAQPEKQKARVTAKGAVLCAVPVAFLATALIVSVFGLSWLWVVPVYGVIGAIVALVLLAT